MILANNPLFGTYHIIVLVICTTLIVLSSIFLRKMKIEIWYKILLYIGIISESLKVISYVIANEPTLGGYLPKGDLPFHLCSMQLFFIAYLNFGKNEKIKRMFLAFMIPTCLIGGIAALILATSSSRNMWNITIQYFLYHTAIVCFAIYLLEQKEIKWEFKDCLNTLKLLAFMALVAVYINSIVFDYSQAVAGESNVNFMYVINPPQDGLPLLNKDHGWAVYMVHYAFVALFAVTLVYIKPIIEKIKSLHHKKEVVVEE